MVIVLVTYIDIVLIEGVSLITGTYGAVTMDVVRTVVGYCLKRAPKGDS